jgi:ABC-type bacteriocin/lantibiotic exporter with double-glycine peptidase domain
MSKPVYYNQKDSKWRDIPYTIINDPKQTIGYSGCGITCMAMILKTYGYNITPPDTAKLAIDMHDRSANQGTEWEYFPHIAKKYNLEFSQTDSTKVAVKAIKNNALVVCSMSPGYFTKSGHFILAWGIAENGDILVNDPNSTTKNRASKSIFINQCKEYFIFNKKTLDYKQIIEKYTNNPTNWESVIQFALNTAKLKANLGVLNIFEYFPILIQKIYTSKDGSKMKYKDILTKVTNKPNDWIQAIDFAVQVAKDDSNIGLLEIYKYIPTLIEKIHNS